MAKERLEMIGAMGIVVRVKDPNRPMELEVLEAPEISAITLELLTQAHPAQLRVSRDVITVANVVDYHVVGWDPSTQALLVELVDDRRTDR